MKITHPQLYDRWTSSLREWADKNKLDKRYIDWGFWRWKRHPPKMLEIAKEHKINLQARADKKDEITLQAAVGRSPCGLRVLHRSSALRPPESSICLCGCSP